MFTWRKNAYSLGSLIIVFILLFWLIPPLRAGVTGSIDIFTQRTPYSGEGLNAPSDAFAPNQKVIIYALVLYNAQPVKNTLVNFVVEGPPNKASNVTIQISSETNESGIAQISFRIPSNETVAFGIWKASGSTELKGVILRDYLEFKVGWIIELLNVKTLDENLTYCDTFGIGGYMGVEVTLKNIAMTPKNFTLCLNVFDELMYPVSFVRIENLIASPNEKIMHLFIKIFLPEFMLIGSAFINVSAYTPSTEGEIPYSPGVSANFSVVPFGQIYPKFHDVSVFITLSETTLRIGQKLIAEIYVQNEGTETENFEICLSLNSVITENRTIENLSSYSQKRMVIEWDTSELNEGIYSLIANITPLEDEADLTDNIYKVNVELSPEKPPQPIPIHDIAVIDVTPLTTQVYQGEALDVYVTVKNNGTEVESFNITLYCDSDVIGVLPINDLGAGEFLDLTFVWDTTGVAVGEYTLKAVASVIEGEINIKNNEFIDGVVEIIAVPVGYVHDIAVVEVEASPRIVKKGDITHIVVTVVNEGNFSESFDLTVFYDGKAVGTSRVSLLEAGQKRLFSFSWNTSDVAVGVYTIKAEVSHVAGEEDLADNVFVDGKVEVVAVEEYRPPWPLWLLLFVIGLLALLGLTVLGIILYRRRRLKKFRRAFFTGWNAWFYRYDLLKIEGPE